MIMKKLLDIGCGPGTLTNDAYYHKFVGSYQIYGIDIGEQNINTIKTRWPKGIFQVANAEHIPFQNDYFDQVISRHTLEHVKDIDKVINEIHRVCKQNGEILIAVPTLVFEKAIVKLIPGYLGHHHERIIRIDELEQMLTVRGFIIFRRTHGKWPMFVIILFLAYVSQFTDRLSMEMQTGVFHVSHNKYLNSFLPSSLQFGLTVYLLAFFDTFFWFLNYFIPWETEIAARKR